MSLCVLFCFVLLFVFAFLVVGGGVGGSSMFTCISKLTFED